MNTPRKLRIIVSAAALAVAASTVLSASSGSASNGIEKHQEWAGTWTTGNTPASTAGSSQLGFTNQSVRSIIHTTVGGEAARFRFSNSYGTKHLSIGHATVALPDTSTPKPDDIIPGSIRELTFGGKTSATVYKGAELFSDPVTMPVAAGQDLVITVFYPVATGATTFHFTSRQLTFVYGRNGAGFGDRTSDVSGTVGEGTGADSTPRENFYHISGVDVLRSKAGGSVVIFGDSIANGVNSTMGAALRWPDRLAVRMHETPRNGRIPGVLNVGISGNRVTHDGTDPINGSPAGFAEIGNSALARLRYDVLSQTGVCKVVLHLGINDIWMSGESAEVIIDGLKQIGVQLRQHNIQVVIGTLMPYKEHKGGGWSTEREATRQAVNEFIRTSQDFDGLVDFDKVMRDPADPEKLNPAFDSGDHIHPNDAGYQAMADAVNLNLLR